MNFVKLEPRPALSGSIKLQKSFQQLESLLGAIEQHVTADGTHTIADNTAAKISEEITAVNAIPDLNGDSLLQSIKKAQTEILKLLEKEEKIVPVNHYRKLWMMMGMSTFGLPIGVAFGLSLGNMGMLGIGLPIGIAIGIGVGSSMDNKAKLAGRQLDFEVKL